MRLKPESDHRPTTTETRTGRRSARIPERGGDVSRDQVTCRIIRPQAPVGAILPSKIYWGRRIASCDRWPDDDLIRSPLECRLCLFRVDSVRGYVQLRQSPSAGSGRAYITSE
jgi:hypothetical protein